MSETWGNQRNTTITLLCPAPGFSQVSLFWPVIILPQVFRTAFTLQDVTPEQAMDYVLGWRNSAPENVFQKYKQITKSGGGAKNGGLVIGHPADLQQEGRWDDFFSTWSGPR